MTTSTTTNNLFSSLCKAQGEFVTLPKDKSGYGYKYTDLDTVISTVRPILAKHGLGFCQSLTTVSTDRMNNAITTRLFSAEGEWIEDTVILPDVAMAKTNAAQNMGAAITYMKRYALCALLGISSDEDVDAATPEQKPTYSKPATKAPAKAEVKEELKGGPTTTEQVRELKNLWASKYPDGKPVFTAEEIAQHKSYRKGKYTADELIEFVKNALTNRLSK